MAHMVQVTRKPSGPMGQMEMEKGTTGTRDTLAIGSHSTDAEGPSEDFYDELQVSSDTQAVGSHMSDGDGPSGPIGLMEMENGPTNTHDM